MLLKKVHHDVASFLALGQDVPADVAAPELVQRWLKDDKFVAFVRRKAELLAFLELSKLAHKASDEKVKVDAFDVLLTFTNAYADYDNAVLDESDHSEPEKKYGFQSPQPAEDVEAEEGLELPEEVEAPTL